MWKVLAKYLPEMPVPIHADGLLLWFRTQRGTEVPLHKLSDGERAVLLLFGELALRAPEEGVVLIDELEQHLHPRWQLGVLEGIGSLLPNAQLIVTTQSPYLKSLPAKGNCLMLWGTVCLFLKERRIGGVMLRFSIHRLEHAGDIRPIGPLFRVCCTPLAMGFSMVAA